ncbi:MAG: hypothetical protein ABIJ92_03125 [Candidatus Aenigmatarchaeota archaeon]
MKIKGMTPTVSILLLTIITVSIGSTAYVLIINTFDSVSGNVEKEPFLSPPAEFPECEDINIEITNVCHTTDKLQIEITNPNADITSNSQIVIEGSLYTAIIPFTPPELDLEPGESIILEVDYEPSVLGSLQRVAISPIIRTDNGDTECPPSVYVVEEEIICE